MALNIEQTANDLENAIQFLLNQEGVTSQTVGVVGFCMGGQLALLAATISDRIGAVIDFYGIHPHVKPDFSRLKAPVLGIFGEKDAFVPPSAVQTLKAEIQQAGGAIDVHLYPDADHAFFNDTRPEVYNPTAAAAAWRQTLAFFQQHLMTA